MFDVSIKVATADMAAKDIWAAEEKIPANPFKEGFKDRLKEIYILYREMWDVSGLVVRFYYEQVLFYEVKLNPCGIVEEKHYLVVKKELSGGEECHSIPYADK